jgi:hypothetical protein
MLRSGRAVRLASRQEGRSDGAALIEGVTLTSGRHEGSGWNGVKGSWVDGISSPGSDFLGTGARQGGASGLGGKEDGGTHKARQRRSRKANRQTRGERSRFGQACHG